MKKIRFEIEVTVDDDEDYEQFMQLLAETGATIISEQEVGP